MKKWKELSLEDKATVTQIKTSHNVCLIIALILLIFINGFQLYDSTFSNDAKYLNSAIQYVSENKNDAELSLDLVHTAPSNSKISVLYGVLLIQESSAIANILSNNEYEPIIMPEYNGNNDDIVQLLTDVEALNQLAEKSYQLIGSKTSDELNEEEIKEFETVIANVTKVSESALNFNQKYALINCIIRLIETISLITFIYVECRSALNKYYNNLIKNTKA